MKYTFKNTEISYINHRVRWSHAQPYIKIIGTNWELALTCFQEIVHKSVGKFVFILKQDYEFIS